MVSNISQLLCIISLYVTAISVDPDAETFDYYDRTCDSHNCFLEVLKSYGNCQLSTNKQYCFGYGCKFIGNSNMRMCINPYELHQKTDAELLNILLESSVSIGSQQLCVYDDNDNVYDMFCKQMMNGTECDISSKKCIMTPQQYSKVDDLFENEIKKETSIIHRLPYNYTNNILIVIDGTGSKLQFEAAESDVIKGGEYRMKPDARWTNGNWANHASNFYEDYRGAKYYWYGPDEGLNAFAAREEVLGLVYGAVDVICEFIGNQTIDEFYNNEINIDLVGYSRGGYVVTEIARLLDRDGCEYLNISGNEIDFRFMGLYDPVSSIYGDIGDVVPNTDFNQNDGLFVDEDYVYNADTMPLNVDHIVISYGDPTLGSRQVFNTVENVEDNAERSDEIETEYFMTTHGGIGGTPMQGDFDMVLLCIQNEITKNLVEFCRFKDGTPFDNVGDIDDEFDAKVECLQSMNSDMFIRSKANECGLPIDGTTSGYYQFYECPDDFKNEL